ncbi:MAG TPA: phosphoenolpyruvate--protein phosphotransferase [Verrucomicrobiae bacterium]
MKTTTTTPVMFKGVSISPGVARGAAWVLDDHAPLTIPRRTIPETEVASELARFAAALNEAEGCLRGIQKEVQQTVGAKEARVFDAQVLMLRDPGFIKQVTESCSTRKINIEAAVADTVEKLTARFASLKDACLRERAADVRDVGRRVLERLLTHRCEHHTELPEGAIVVTGELLPTTTARINFQAVRGVVTERGGRTSHAAILTRSLGIPGVIGIKEASQRIQTGDPLIVDGLAGMVHVHPSPAVHREYDRLEADFAAYREQLHQVIDLPAVTADDVAVNLSANIGKIADAEAAMLFKADGVGLYRTEFAFLVRDRFPTEEDQVEIYLAVADRLQTKPLVIRVLDLGSDKTLPHLPMPAEANPALGLRGTRLLLKHPDLLRSQLGAILRVNATHPVSVLLPMIGSVEEVREVKAILEETKSRLRRDQLPFNPSLRVGAMIETPAAAMVAGDLADEVDFFSVGTNDLIQYLLCADRTSPEVLAAYEPLHPAVLRVLKTAVDAAHAAGKEISVCGEMAGNATCVELLLGLGLRSFSVTPGEILAVKKAIRLARISAAEQLAAEVLAMRTIEEIKTRVAQRWVDSNLPPIKSNGTAAGNQVRGYFECCEAS